MYIGVYLHKVMNYDDIMNKTESKLIANTRRHSASLVFKVLDIFSLITILALQLPIVELL